MARHVGTRPRARRRTARSRLRSSLADATDTDAQAVTSHVARGTVRIVLTPAPGRRQADIRAPLEGAVALAAGLAAGRADGGASDAAATAVAEAGRARTTVGLGATEEPAARAASPTADEKVTGPEQQVANPVQGVPSAPAHRVRHAIWPAGQTQAPRLLHVAPAGQSAAEQQPPAATQRPPHDFGRTAGQTQRPLRQMRPVVRDWQSPAVQHWRRGMHRLRQRFVPLGQGAATWVSPSRLATVPAIAPPRARRELIERVRISNRSPSLGFLQEC
jgi:hypothetical protein